MNKPTITLHKSKHCDGCEFENHGTFTAPGLVVTHQELEHLWSQIKIEPAPYNKGDKHKHHMVRKSWLEVKDNG